MTMTVGAAELETKLVTLLWRGMTGSLKQTRDVAQDLSLDQFLEFSFSHSIDPPIPESFCCHHLDHRDCLNGFLHQ